MARPATSVCLSPEQERQPREWIAQAKHQRLIAQRAQIVLLAAEHRSTEQIARALGIGPARVSKWRIRFAQLGIHGLETADRSGKPRAYGDTVNARILSLIEEPPPEPHLAWTGPLVAEAIGDVSVDYVWRVLRNEGVSLRSQNPTSCKTAERPTPELMCVMGLFLSGRGSAFVVSLLDPERYQPDAILPSYCRLPNVEAVNNLKSRYPEPPTLTAALRWASRQASPGLLSETAPRTLKDFLADALAASGVRRNHAFLVGETPAVPSGLCAHIMPGARSWENELGFWFSVCSEGMLDARENMALLLAAISEFLSSHRPEQAPFEWYAWRVRVRSRQPASWPVLIESR